MPQHRDTTTPINEGRRITGIASGGNIIVAEPYNNPSPNFDASEIGAIAVKAVEGSDYAELGERAKGLERPIPVAPTKLRKPKPYRQ